MKRLVRKYWVIQWLKYLPVHHICIVTRLCIYFFCFCKILKVFAHFSNILLSQFILGILIVNYWSTPFLEVVVQRCSVKKVFLEISQNSQENTCARVSFLIKLQAYEHLDIEHLWWLLLHFFLNFNSKRSGPNPSVSY